MPIVYDDAGPSSINASDYLYVSGRRLATLDGREVTLRGVNLGGWLVTETWMCGFTDSNDTAAHSGAAGLWGRSTKESLEDRFGVADAGVLENAWEDHWITTQDLDKIRDSGFNVVRVPFSYRTLQHADGTWILDAHHRIDFSRLDWIVREASSRGIYTIFDLHVWPEQRTAQDKIGRSDGTKIRTAMAQMWTTIASHYRGNAGIAAFDLINEFPGSWGVQQTLAQAVHKGDPNRVQVIEGFTLAEFLKLHEKGLFPNSVFSDHYYASAPLTNDEFAQRLKETRDSPVPIYIGEFLAADFPAVTRTMNALNVSWSSWTYKTVDEGDWGAFNYYSTLKTDIQHDAYSSILAKWSTDLTAWQAQNQPLNYSINQLRLAQPLATAGQRASDLIKIGNVSPQ